MEVSVNDTCTVYAEKMSKQLWKLRMSSDRAWAKCQLMNINKEV